MKTHINDLACICKHYEDYQLALDAIDDSWSHSECLSAIIEKTGFSYEKSKGFVDAMLDTGYISEKT